MALRPARWAPSAASAASGRWGGPTGRPVHLSQPAAALGEQEGEVRHTAASGVGGGLGEHAASQASGGAARGVARPQGAPAGEPDWGCAGLGASLVCRSGRANTSRYRDAAWKASKARLWWRLGEAQLTHGLLVAGSIASTPAA